jgi:hypothetical protein
MQVQGGLFLDRAAIQKSEYSVPIYKLLAANCLWTVYCRYYGTVVAYIELVSK